MPVNLTAIIIYFSIGLVIATISHIGAIYIELKSTYIATDIITLSDFYNAFCGNDFIATPSDMLSNYPLMITCYPSCYLFLQ